MFRNLELPDFPQSLAEQDASAKPPNIALQWYFLSQSLWMISPGGLSTCGECENSSWHPVKPSDGGLKARLSESGSPERQQLRIQREGVPLGSTTLEVTVAGKGGIEIGF